jgi:hypothetical protein
VELQGAAGNQRNSPENFVDPGGSSLPPGGRCPFVQQWHGARETSSGKFGPGEIGDPEVNWPEPE